MIEHGFSYSDLKEMSLRELRFWIKALDDYYEKKNAAMGDI
jgi:hypothetical protein